jgi:hypothetical protein
LGKIYYKITRTLSLFFELDRQKAVQGQQAKLLKADAVINTDKRGGNNKGKRRYLFAYWDVQKG